MLKNDVGLRNEFTSRDWGKAGAIRNYSYPRAT
jgi:hypothetical protein